MHTCLAPSKKQQAWICGALAPFPMSFSARKAGNFRAQPRDVLSTDCLGPHFVLPFRALSFQEQRRQLQAATIVAELQGKLHGGGAGNWQSL